MTIKAINVYPPMRAAISDPGQPVVLANSSETPTSGTTYAHRKWSDPNIVPTLEARFRPE